MFKCQHNIRLNRFLLGFDSSPPRLFNDSISKNVYLGGAESDNIPNASAETESYASDAFYASQVSHNPLKSRIIGRFGHSPTEATQSQSLIKILFSRILINKLCDFALCERT